MRRAIYPVVWWVSLLLATPLLAAPPFDAIYAFGDSLTDTGNEPAEPYLHYDGRWSNGELWVEYLSGRFGFPYNASNNLAHSGAQVNLQSKGARCILVPNTVDIIEIPTLNYLPDLLRNYLRGKVQLFNQRLATALDDLQAAHPDLKLFHCDTF